jgi:hypothetical protein
MAETLVFPDSHYRLLSHGRMNGAQIIVTPRYIMMKLNPNIT